MDEVTKQSHGAKWCSRFAMIFSSLWIAILTLLRGASITKLTIEEIIFSGLAIVGIWCPTFVSIYLDKIKEIKQCGRK